MPNTVTTLWAIFKVASGVLYLIAGLWWLVDTLKEKKGKQDEKDPTLNKPVIADKLHRDKEI